MLKLEISPGFSVRQLRLFEGTGDAILFAAAGFALSQSQ